MNSVHPKQRSITDSNGPPEGQQGVTMGSNAGSRPLAVLIGLLRITAQTGGAGWSPLVYSILVFVMANGTCLSGAWFSFQQGLLMLRNGSKFFEAALRSKFFGVTFLLMWSTLAITFVCGRRRTAVLLKDALDMLQDVSVFSSYSVQRNRNNRRLVRMLIAIFVVSTVGLLGYSMAFATGSDGPMYGWVLTVVFLAICIIVFASFVMISFKFALLCSLFTCGFETINAELQAMADGERPVNWVTLRRLRLFQARLSHSFSTVTDRLSPELTSSIFYGTLSQVITIFLVIAAVQEGTILTEVWAVNLFLLPAVISTLVPSWSCQTMLEVAEETRAALLKLEPRDAAADRQVTALLEAVKRDLDTFGDLGPLPTSALQHPGQPVHRAHLHHHHGPVPDVGERM